MSFVLGLLLIIAGVAGPMVMLPWLSRRLKRDPAPSARQVWLMLALNGLLPLSLLFWGIGFAVPVLRAMLVIRMVAVLTSLAAVAVLRMLWAERAGW